MDRPWDALMAAAPAGFSRFDVAAVPAPLRALLVTDGTVTQILEALFFEPIHVERLHQREEKLAEPEPTLELAPGARVIRREVALMGRDTGQIYATASSTLAPERIPRELRSDIQQTDGGLGRLMARNALESRRELHWVGAADQLPVAPASPPTPQRCIVRSYVVIAGGHALMQITEAFLRCAFAPPSHDA